ncbi:hypothetical protein D3C81_1985690 [compost metagenome]
MLRATTSPLLKCTVTAGCEGKAKVSSIPWGMMLFWFMRIRWRSSRGISVRAIACRIELLPVAFSPSSMVQGDSLRPWPNGLVSRSSVKCSMPLKRPISIRVMYE